MHYPYSAEIACHHDCWSNPTEKTPDMVLDAFGVGCDQHSAFAMVRMQGCEQEKKKAYDSIRKQPQVIECRKKGRDCFFIRVKKDSSFYAKLVGNNCLVDNRIPIRCGVETERIFGFSKRAITDSINLMKEVKDVKIISIMPFEHFTLTQKEQELLRLAMKLGYYEIPRKAYAADLGDELGLKKSIVLERLRRIEKKVLEKYYLQG